MYFTQMKCNVLMLEVQYLENDNYVEVVREDIFCNDDIASYIQ